MLNGVKDLLIKALLESGEVSSIIEEKFVSHLRPNERKMRWVTIAGKFSTYGTVKTQFQLQVLSTTATITYKIHVTKLTELYNMIIGRD